MKRRLLSSLIASAFPGKTRPGYSGKRRRRTIDIEKMEDRILLSTTVEWVSPDGASSTGAGTSSSDPASLSYLFAHFPAGGDVTVNLMDGIYTNGGNTIDLTDTESGSGSTFVTFQNAPGAHPIISGGTELTGWTELGAGAVSGSTVYYASTSGIVRDLYINDQRAVRSRLPQTGFANITSWSGLNNVLRNNPAPNQFKKNNQTITAKIPKSVDSNLAAEVHVAPSGNPIEMVLIQGYTISRIGITKVTSSGSSWIVNFVPSEVDSLIQLLDKPTGQEPTGIEGDTFYAAGDPQPFYLDNIPSDQTDGLASGAVPALQPGEWYQDLNANRIYYCIASGGMTGVTAFVPTDLTDPNAPTPVPGLSHVSNPLLDVGVMGSGTPITNVKIQGITFEYSAFNDTSTDGYIGLGQGISTRVIMPVKPDPGLRDTYLSQNPAIRIMDASNVTIDDCIFEHLGGSGIQIYSKSNNNFIEGNTLFDIAGDGIDVNGHLVDTAGVQASDISQDDSIIANTITRIGEEYYDSVGILGGFVDNLKVWNNDIHNVPDDGIVLGRSLNTEVSTVMDVEHNNVYNFKEMLQDGGGIYASGLNWHGSTGSKIEYNYVHDVWRPAAAGAQTQGGHLANPKAIYLDQNAVGISVVSNAIYDTMDPAIANSKQGGIFTNVKVAPFSTTAASGTANYRLLVTDGADSDIISMAGPSPYDSEKIEAENFDPSTSPTPTKTTTIGLSGVTNGTYISGFSDGQDVKYDFTVPQAGYYAFYLDNANTDGGGDSVDISLDGGPTVASYTLASTGGTFTLQQYPGVIYVGSAGSHVLTLQLYGSLSTLQIDSLNLFSSQVGAPYDGERIEAESFDPSTSPTPSVTTPPTAPPGTNGTYISGFTAGQNIIYRFTAPETAGYVFSLDDANTDPNDYVKISIDGVLQTAYSLYSTGGGFTLERRPGVIYVTAGSHVITWQLEGDLSTLKIDSFTLAPSQVGEAVNHVDDPITGWQDDVIHMVNGLDGNPDGVVDFVTSDASTTAYDYETVTAQVVVPYTGTYVLGLRTATINDNIHLRITAGGKTLTGEVPRTSSSELFYGWYFGMPPAGPQTLAPFSIHPGGAYTFALSAGTNNIVIQFIPTGVTDELYLDSVYLAPVSGVSGLI